jgi:O-acetyl-ADP-ribose deacetylase (regulator of RNase III)
MELEVVEGDITELDVDAVANAANNELWMGAGVAGAIKRAGGAEIEQEAGNLRAKHVVHAAVMGQDLQTSAELISQATRRTFEVADELGSHSLAMPAFGTGVGGFPIGQCAELMVTEARAFEPVNLERIVFAVFGHDAEQAFRAAVGE